MSTNVDMLPMDPKIVNAINNKKAVFFITATNTLCELIVRNDHPVVIRLPSQWKSMLLSGQGICIDSSLVYRYISGTLDADHTFLFENCEIRLNGAESILKLA